MIKQIIFTFLLFCVNISAQSSFELGLSGSGGNTNSINVLSALKIDKSDSTFEYQINGKVVYTKRDDIYNDRMFQAGLKLDYKYSNSFTNFLFCNSEQNTIRKIEFKLESGIGTKYIIDSNIDVSLALLYDRTLYYGGLQGSKIIRWSLRNRVKEKIGHLIWENVIFLQPEITSFKNYYLTMNTSLSLPITRSLLLSNKFDLLYDNFNIVGLKKTDWNLSISAMILF